MIVVIKKSCRKTLNVLTKFEEEESLLINLITKITDPESKTQYMSKLKTLLTDDKETKIRKKAEKPNY